VHGCLIALSATALAAQDPGPILERAGAAYRTVSTLSADFVQVVVNPLLGTPDTTYGTLYLMRPNHFAMRFIAPKGDRIVADGRHLWLYTPSTTPGQVLRRPIPESGGLGPNLMGQFVERPTERYHAR
jgi:outer membrane lipoprotein carrier protein